MTLLDGPSTCGHPFLLLPPLLEQPPQPQTGVNLIGSKFFIWHVFKFICLRQDCETGWYTLYFISNAICFISLPFESHHSFKCQCRSGSGNNNNNGHVFINNLSSVMLSIIISSSGWCLFCQSKEFNMKQLLKVVGPHSKSQNNSRHSSKSILNQGTQKCNHT